MLQITQVSKWCWYGRRKCTFHLIYPKRWYQYKCESTHAHPISPSSNARSRVTFNASPHQTYSLYKLMLRPNGEIMAIWVLILLITHFGRHSKWGTVVKGLCNFVLYCLTEAWLFLACYTLWIDTFIVAHGALLLSNQNLEVYQLLSNWNRWLSLKLGEVLSVA